MSGNLDYVSMRCCDFFGRNVPKVKKKWISSPFRPIITEYSRKSRGDKMKKFVSKLFLDYGLPNSFISKFGNYKEEKEEKYIVLNKSGLRNKIRIAVRMASESGRENSNTFTFNQVRPKNYYDFLILVYVYPEKILFNCYSKKEEAILALRPQHTRSPMTETFVLSESDKQKFMTFDDVVEKIRNEVERRKKIEISMSILSK